MKLTGEQTEAICKALRLAFDRFVVLEWLLREKLQRNIHDYVDPGGLDEVVPKLVRRADTDGWVIALVQVAVEVQRQVAPLREAAEAIGVRTSLPGSALPDLSFFDLEPIDKVWSTTLAAVQERSDAGPVLGFGIANSEERFLECLSKRLRRQMINQLTDEIDPVSLDALVDSTERAAGRLLRYKTKLKTKSLLGRVRVERAPASAVAGFWQRICDELHDAGDHRLVLVFVGPQAVMPAEVRWLPDPDFRFDHVRAWTASVAAAQQWAPPLSDGFTTDIVAAFQSGEPLDVWETYDQLREALVVASDEAYLEQLRKKVTHVPAPD